MKAALIGGEYHGKAIKVLYPNTRLWLPLRIPDAPEVKWLEDDLPLYEFKPWLENYVLEPRLCVTDEKDGTTLLIYTHSNTRAANFADTMQRARALNLIARLLGVAVGLNRWLDAEQETRLCYDADLSRSLFQTRVPFESAIADIVGRRNTERLARRFPETFTT